MLSITTPSEGGLWRVEVDKALFGGGAQSLHAVAKTKHLQPGAAFLCRSQQQSIVPATVLRTLTNSRAPSGLQGAGRVKEDNAASCERLCRLCRPAHNVATPEQKCGHIHSTFQHGNHFDEMHNCRRKLPTPVNTSQATTSNRDAL